MLEFEEEGFEEFDPFEEEAESPQEELPEETPPNEEDEEEELERKIAEWKTQYPELFSTVINDQLYIWRPLTRDEWRKMIRRGIIEDNAQQEMIANTCVLWPEDYGRLIESEPAGVPSAIAKAIQNVSGFQVTLEPLRVDLLSDEDIETLDPAVQKAIPAALMQFPKRVYLSIIGDRQFLWRLLTRKEFREMREAQQKDLLFMEEKLFSKCVLAPVNDLRKLLKDYAGIGSTIAEQVTFMSGFGSEAEIKKI